MAGFHFEHNLPHQSAAVAAVLNIFNDIGSEVAINLSQNPTIPLSTYIGTVRENIRHLQKKGELQLILDTDKPDELVFDISMETGTGKTYAYTKAMFELNKQLNIFKFIIAVPRVAIKAGTVSFLKSAAAKHHFASEYPNTELVIHEVSSKQKSKGKSKKDIFPSAIKQFCMAQSSPNNISHGTKKIHVLIINAGMINSATLEKQFDITLFNKFSVPYEALAHTRAITIIDEPHLFKTDNKSFNNLQRFKPQCTLRYGATFNGEYKNLIYQLNAVDAFNQDLVKGIIGHIEQFNGGVNSLLKLTGLDTNEATFQLNDGINTQGNTQNNTVKLSKLFKLLKNDSLEIIHSAMKNLTVVSFNKSKLVLSNGLELRKGDSINPFSYDETLQNKMIHAAIVRHFEIERELLLQRPRIKPLTLFFIDNIPSYRDKNGAMRLYFEHVLKTHIEYLIAKEIDTQYRTHLEIALKDIALLHGGYFSIDTHHNNDEAIEQETLEILHDKEALLSIQNPRRFIFSKWTLREGWDNPNIFQICKLRSSGSETSKLQEVGRGLRLPVNEHMVRVQDKSFFLHYYVDFTEADFIQKLTHEINEKSGVLINEKQLDTILINALLKHYPEFECDDDLLLETLGNAGYINFNKNFKENKFNLLKDTYPKAFDNKVGGIKADKIIIAGSTRNKATIRQGQYNELASLWESIHQKTVLEYKMNSELEFKQLFKDYLIKNINRFIQTGSLSIQQRIVIDRKQVSYREENSINDSILPFKTMAYQSFLKDTATALSLNIQTIHTVFSELLIAKQFDINNFLSPRTIRRLKQGFDEYLMQHVMSQFSIDYRRTHCAIHPTQFTNELGIVKPFIASSDVGIYASVDIPPDNYLFNEIFYDSDIELNNIKHTIKEVVVYTKIPKNSIRIPLVGGFTYSPDFAYVIKNHDGNIQLNLIVESKGKNHSDLSDNENQKIRLAELFFNTHSNINNNINNNIKILFKTQLSNMKMVDIIKSSLVDYSK